MIEKMKKVTLLVSERARDRFVSELRKAGVVHIRSAEEPVSHDIKFLADRIARIDRMISILEPYSDDAEKDGKECAEEEFLETEQKISDMYSEKENLRAEMQELRKKVQWFRPWGDFDPGDLRLLGERGVNVKLYRLTRKQFKALPEEVRYKKTGCDGEYVCLAVFDPSEETVFPGEEDVPPERSPSFMKKKIEEKEKRIWAIEKEFKARSGWLARIKACRRDLEKKKTFQTVKHGMAEEEKFAYLQGYCPVKFLDRVIALAGKESAGYVFEDPDRPEETPTLITNPKWIEIIKPVFRFMNTLPGYDEFDISAVFLVFFSLFFAMLVGDAGYGLIFILITYLVRKKATKAPPQPFFLMYLMGVSTVIWGAVTGTWFGSRTIAQLPGIRTLVIDPISSFGDTQDFLIYFCFILGAIQLTIAHILRFAREMNSPRSLAQLGWISIVWGMFFAAGTLVIKKPFPGIGGWLLGAGVILVLVFSEFQKNVLKGMASTLTSLPLNVISAFSDVVSYLRLFAVGYATVVLAQTFNGMAMGGADGFLGGVAAAFILFFGHALNILLALMAVIVHGIRLNMLEFSANHMGMQWSGKEYKPFRE